MLQLHILNGSMAGTRWVAGSFPFSIGRSPTDTLQVEDPGVWNRHCHLELRSDHRAALISASGAATTVNGHPADDVILRNGDLIELGSLKLQFGLSPTAHRGLRLRESLTWIAVALLSLTQIALVYILATDL